jgi:hypothetical protein
MSCCKTLWTMRTGQRFSTSSAFADTGAPEAQALTGRTDGFRSSV